MLKIIGFFFLLSCLISCQSEESSPNSVVEPTIKTEVKTKTMIDSLLALGNSASAKTDSIVSDTIVIDSSTIVKKIERPTRKPAQIKFEELKYTYDTISQGEEVTHSFYFTNTGERPLTITGTEGSCGCTRASYPFVDIAPNEKGKIEATFSSKGKEGNQSTTVTVYSNASPKQHTLVIYGYVEKKEE
jgi:hypothetical protein